MVRIFYIIISFLISAPIDAKPLTVFAPASLQGVLETVNMTYPDEVRVVFAGSSVLARQIIHGAPADIFISANPAWMDELESQNLLVTGSRQDLLTNSLAVIGQGRPLSSLRELPYQLAGRRLAVALTDAVPAGIYARQALESSGIWRNLRKQLAEADNVRSAAALVSRGEVPFGIVYKTDARLFEQLVIAYEIPANAHDPIVYPVAALDGGDPTATEYLAHLTGDHAREVFTAFGFGVPK